MRGGVYVPIKGSVLVCNVLLLPCYCQPAPLWHCVTLALFINVLIIIIIIITCMRWAERAGQLNKPTKVKVLDTWQWRLLMTLHHRSAQIRHTQVKGSHSFTCTPTRLSVQWMVIPAFAFPAKAGTLLSTTVKWKAELAPATRSPAAATLEPVTSRSRVKHANPWEPHIPAVSVRSVSELTEGASMTSCGSLGPVIDTAIQSPVNRYDTKYLPCHFTSLNAGNHPMHSHICVIRRPDLGPALVGTLYILLLCVCVCFCLSCANVNVYLTLYTYFRIKNYSIYAMFMGIGTISPRNRCFNALWGRY